MMPCMAWCCVKRADSWSNNPFSYCLFHATCPTWMPRIGKWNSFSCLYFNRATEAILLPLWAYCQCKPKGLPQHQYSSQIPPYGNWRVRRFVSHEDPDTGNTHQRWLFKVSCHKIVKIFSVNANYTSTADNSGAREAVSEVYFLPFAFNMWNGKRGVGFRIEL